MEAVWIAAGGDDDLIGEQISDVATGFRMRRIRAAAAAGRRRLSCNGGLKERAEFPRCSGRSVLLHEAIRVRAGVGEAGQLALPIGRDEAEGIQRFGSPRLREAVFLEDDVGDARCLSRQLMESPAWPPPMMITG